MLQKIFAKTPTPGPRKFLLADSGQNFGFYYSSSDDSTNYPNTSLHFIVSNSGAYFD
jgi:hypothetical protein